MNQNRDWGWSGSIAFDFEDNNSCDNYDEYDDSCNDYNHNDWNLSADTNKDNACHDYDDYDDSIHHDYDDNDSNQNDCYLSADTYKATEVCHTCAPVPMMIIVHCYMLL